VKPEEAVAAYMASWAEPDEAKRRALLEDAWAEDGTYLDPSGKADGREALVQHIAGFQSTFAGHKMLPASGLDHHDGYLRFGWKMLGPDDKQILEGVDFGSFDDEGRIKQIVGFFGPWPEVT
jgi:hypothetical protein